MNISPGSPGSARERQVETLVVPSRGKLWADSSKHGECDPKLLDGIAAGVRSVD